MEDTKESDSLGVDNEITMNKSNNSGSKEGSSASGDDLDLQGVILLSQTLAYQQNFWAELQRNQKRMAILEENFLKMEEGFEKLDSPAIFKQLEDEDYIDEKDLIIDYLQEFYPNKVLKGIGSK